VSAVAQLLIFVAILAVVFAVMTRPARNQQRTMQRLQSQLAVGDEVVISAGIFGTIRAVDEAKVDLEIAPGTVVTVARQVVVRRVEDEPAEQSVGQSPEMSGEGTDVPADDSAGRPTGAADEESE
jgi:preprotein translocase subunit YajC